MARSNEAAAATRRPRAAKAGWLGRWEDRIRRVPAPIMVPRLLFAASVFGLVAFGLAMVYSASSIKGLTAADDPSYYLVKQLVSLGIGLFLMLVAWKVDYHAWASGIGLKLIMGASFVVLLCVLVIGVASHGASRWISIAGLTLQPAEFVKFVVVAAAAQLLCRWGGRAPHWTEALRQAAPILVLVLMVLMQPDKGTTFIICAALFCMVWDSGAWDRRTLARAGVVAVVLFFVISLRDEYSRQRFLTMLNPEADPYGDGYQVTQGFYAFGSGGLLGVGLGMGSQKYAYLPEMHNDFILAVIGEELGAVGVVALMALFGLLLWSSLKIAEQAPDELGQLIVLGCAMLFVGAFLLNALGVLGLFPMSGKAIPFVSYGGSAMMGSMLGVGMILSVARATRLPETDGERRRRSLSMVQEGAAPQGGRALAVVAAPARQPGVEGSTAGEPRARSFRVLDGGSASGAPGRTEGSATTGAGRSERRGFRQRGLEAHPEARVVRDGSGRERIELGRSSSDRLRPSRGPEVRDRRGASDRHKRR